ncbi:MAG: hypothetical protein GYB67_14105 [Chloroflexi bacterium]|nr:hypothetical protein [Chloroflexota bacterium]
MGQRQREARFIRRLLWGNGLIGNPLYILGGLNLARRSLRAERPLLRGVGLGIVIQGVFLLIFDISHALSVPEQTTEGGPHDN